MECHVTLPACGPDGFRSEQFDPFPNEGIPAILNADFFGQDEDIASVSGEMQFRGIAGPSTALRLDAGAGGGMQIGSLSGADTTPLYDGDRMIGRLFENADAKYCWLGGVLPADRTAPRSAQAGQALQSIQNALAGAGMDFHDIVRTWFYVDRILEWYRGFNRVRTAFFKRHGIIHMPASTGIGIPNAAGAAVVAKVIAVRPKTGKVSIRRVQSPLQCEASCYGSSFSRAMEVCDSSTRTLHVSGTASIGPTGQTAHVGNTAGQIEKTMEVVGALLEQAGMVWSDTTRAMAYFRDSEHISLWHDYCRNRQLPPLPIILIPSDICRDDLLFEIELDAACASVAGHRLDI